VKYIVREGKKRGRGHYLATSMLYNGSNFYHYTTKQRKARRFDTEEEARGAAESVIHVDDYRIVKLRERDD